MYIIHIVKNCGYDRKMWSKKRCGSNCVILEWNTEIKQGVSEEPCQVRKKSNKNVHQIVARRKRWPRIQIVLLRASDVDG